MNIKTTSTLEELRIAMRSWSAGVTVVTAQHEGRRHGMTVNSFTSISIDPALIIISLQKNTKTHEFVTKSGAFGLTMLSARQTQISDLFAGRVPEVEDRFEGLHTETLVTGSPLLAGGLAWLDCRIQQMVDAGSNTLIIAEVVAARSLSEEAPLVYHNRGYWTVSKL